jgi:hypothetical protein
MVLLRQVRISTPVSTMPSRETTRDFPREFTKDRIVTEVCVRSEAVQLRAPPLLTTRRSESNSVLWSRCVSEQVGLTLTPERFEMRV